MKPARTTAYSFLSLLQSGPILAECTHLDRRHDGTPSGTGCKECLEVGDTWFQLRICLTCGHAGCCDTSRNKHARKHFEETGHPMMQSFQPGESWRWCFIDRTEVSEPHPALLTCKGALHAPPQVMERGWG